MKVMKKDKEIFGKSNESVSVSASTKSPEMEEHNATPISTSEMKENVTPISVSESTKPPEMKENCATLLQPSTKCNITLK